MVEQAQYNWRNLSSVVTLRPGVAGEKEVDAFCLKHCEKHSAAIHTILKFFKGRLQLVDLIQLSLKKHQHALAQQVSRTNCLYADLERQRRQG